MIKRVSVVDWRLLFVRLWVRRRLVASLAGLFDGYVCTYLYIRVGLDGAVLFLRCDNIMERKV